MKRLGDTQRIEAPLGSEIEMKDELKAFKRKNIDWRIGDEFFIIESLEVPSFKSFKIKEELISRKYNTKAIEILKGEVGAIVETEDSKLPAYETWDGFVPISGGHIYTKHGVIKNLLFKSYEDAMEFVNKVREDKRRRS